MSHGWSVLSPFEFDREKITFSYVIPLKHRSRPVSATVSQRGDRVHVDTAGRALGARAKKELKAKIGHMLRLDDDLEEFYRKIKKEKSLRWVARWKVGRMIRSATVFEDLVKTLCTTNCSWGLTKTMVSNLVELLGEESDDGRKSFPGPGAMAGKGEKFYRKEIRAGYRSPYFAELADKVASGELNPESWLDSELPTLDLRKEIKSVKGVGDYAADNLLKLIGRYDGLALDSWLRSQFYKKYNRGRACPDRKIEKAFERFGEWKGLVLWCDMTEEWFREIS